MRRIPFSKPFIAGRELHHIARAVALENIAGDGFFTQACSSFFEKRYDVSKALMVTSCTSALEMSVMLCGIGPGDEVILPSFTFVSTANAIVRAGGTPVFVDVRPDTLNIDESLIEDAITDRTKALLPIHYAGVGAEMRAINEIAARHGLMVIEDAAQGVEASIDGRPLGSIGDLGCYSFHETKNFVCGEGGALVVNNPDLVDRAEILRDKGTNRQQFFRGNVDKYTWVDIGSSYVPSEITCAFLFGQLETIDSISNQRANAYRWYEERLQPLADEGLLRLPTVPEHTQTNHHIFYILLPDQDIRNSVMGHLNRQMISAVFHYIPLHNSPMGLKLRPDQPPLPVTEDVAGRILRLPMYHELLEEDVDRIVEEITNCLVNQPTLLAAV
jgi:dTDP-4-amino-4,6-dideoxygalactose transaminase